MPYLIEYREYVNLLTRRLRHRPCTALSDCRERASRGSTVATSGLE